MLPISLKDIRSDIILIASHSKVSKDRRFWNDHIDFMIHKHRAMVINEVFNQTKMIDPIWIQDLGNRNVTTIDSAEEVSIGCVGWTFGKVVLPRVMPLADNAGEVRVASTSHQKTYYRREIAFFLELDPKSLQAKFDTYFRIGDAFYLHPAPSEASFRLILDNPMQGDFFDNTVQNFIEPDLEYAVSDGVVRYNGTNYAPGSTFTGVFEQRTYTGQGRVYFKAMRRPMNENDPYPVSFIVARAIVDNILTRELEIESKKIADIRNDNADQLSLTQALQS